MYRIRLMAIGVLLKLAVLGSSATALAQGTATPSLQDLLKDQYKVSRTGSDSSGFKVIEPGTVLTVAKPGIIATPQAPPHGISFKLPKVCDNTFKRGNLTQPGACAKTTLGSRFLDQSEKVYITKFEVNEKSNKITFNLVECDSCNGVKEKSSMKATVIFEFPEKFLETAEPGQVADVINQLLGPGN